MARRLSVQEITNEQIRLQLEDLVNKMTDIEAKFSDRLQQVHPNFTASALNLLHYLVLRSNEIREAQDFLHHRGLSALANCESHAMSQIQHVLQWLSTNSPEKFKRPPCDFEQARKLKESHNERVLGVSPVSDRPHIMVTFSSEMAEDGILIEEMLHAGMSIARINCAHDDETVWLNMINLLKKAVARTGRLCKIYMDLGGPRIRIKKIVKGRSREKLTVREGDVLVLSSSASSLPKRYHKQPVLIIEPKGLLKSVKTGEHVYFDDGKFESRVTECGDQVVLVTITRISTRKPFIRKGKGINFPDATLPIESLTEQDRLNLPFICQHADLIGYSFVRDETDLEILRKEMTQHTTRKPPAIILKIERLAALQNLPALLLNGMKDESFGVMIARGDLAVEIGFERLSEIQEEILWICEAAHVPVIWATQVLESMNKTGYATRSEITDAAMSVMAECVMLNKGKHVVRTIKMLDDILIRRLGHVDKKRYIMRPLGIAKNFTSG